MTNTMPVLTEEYRQNLISDCKREIQSLIEDVNEYSGEHEDWPLSLQSEIQRQKIALASLEAKVLGYVNDRLDMSKENDGYGATLWKKDWHSACGIDYVKPVYECPPVTALKLPDEWTFCPECGSEEIHYQEGNHKQCANCHQEWHSHINYSRAVKLNLQEFFRKANQQPVPALNLPNYVETSPGADRVRQAVNDVWNRCIDEVKRLNGVTE